MNHEGSTSSPYAWNLSSKRVDTKDFSFQLSSHLNARDHIHKIIVPSWQQCNSLSNWTLNYSILSSKFEYIWRFAKFNLLLQESCTGSGVANQCVSCADDNALLTSSTYQKNFDQVKYPMKLHQLDYVWLVSDCSFNTIDGFRTRRLKARQV